MKRIPTPRKIPTQARSRMMVEAILTATAHIIVKHGYQGTNTNLVAQLAGVSVGSLYQYFPNKDSLIAALHQREAQTLAEMIRDITAQYPQVNSLHEHLSLLVRTLLSHYREETQLLRVLEKHFSALIDQPCEQFYKTEIPNLLQTMLQRWQDSLWRPNLPMAAWMTAHMIRSMLQAYVVETPQIAPRDMEQAIVRSLMALLCGSEGDAREPGSEPAACFAMP